VGAITADVYAYVDNDPLNLTAPSGLDTQFGINANGTAALVILGINVGATAGISVPDNKLNLGGYQLYVTPQVAGMAGGGEFLGAGVSGAFSKSNGPLPLVSGAVNLYAEADVGKVAAVGVGVQGAGNVLSPGYNPPNDSFGGAGVSLPVKGGEGLGLWAGAGLAANGTVATPTIGQRIGGTSSAISSIFGGSSDTKGSPASSSTGPTT